MMLGDGLNDIGVMNSADVSVGVLGGMDLTLQNADMFLAQPDLKGVVQLLEYSAYHGRSVRLILCVSVIYNLIAIGLALANIIHPLVAALIMPLSSLTVILIAWFRNGDKIWKASMSS